MKTRIYIDTSVIGGYYDNEFMVDTRLFFNRIEKKNFDIYLSEVSHAELSVAPQKVRNVLKRIPLDCLIELQFTEEAKQVADIYIKDKVLGIASLNDAYHIAIATVNRIDVVVSWNFKHIVNFNKIRLFNAVNLKLGYPAIDIRSPKELISYEN